MTSATIRNMTRTEFLAPGTTINYRGKSYRILKTNKVNYRIIDASGNQYNLPRHATGTTLAENSGSEPEIKVKSFNPGDRVAYTGTKQPLVGKQGLVFSSHAGKSKVVFENVGSYNISNNILSEVA